MIKKILLGIATSGLLLFCAFIYVAAQFIIYRTVPGDDGMVPLHPRPPTCRRWHLQSLFAANPGSGDQAPVDLSCESALRLPGEDFFARNSLGMRLRYRIFDIPPNSPSTSKLRLNQATNPNHTSLPLWLHIHGITGDILAGSRYRNAAARLGMQMAAMELSNHGLSDNNGAGASWGCREKGDVEAVVGELLARFPDRKIIISASSMGTMALINAEHDLRLRDARHQIVAFALENPISSVKSLFSYAPIPSFGLTAAFAAASWKTGFNLDSCAPSQYLPRVQTPTLVQHGREDSSVPVREVEKFYQSLPPNLFKRLIIYPRGNHLVTWNYQPTQFEQDLAKFFDEAAQQGDHPQRI